MRFGIIFPRYKGKYKVTGWDEREIEGYEEFPLEGTIRVDIEGN